MTMTIEEALERLDSNHAVNIGECIESLKAHARATLAAREGEPDVVARARAHVARCMSGRNDGSAVFDYTPEANHRVGDLLAAYDHLTARLTARLAETERELDAARSDTESMAAAAQSYRLERDELIARDALVLKNIDQMRLNHVRREAKHDEVRAELTTLRAQVTELTLAQEKARSELWLARKLHECDKENETLRAQIERVRRVCEAEGFDVRDSYSNVLESNVVRADDILDALAPESPSTAEGR